LQTPPGASLPTLRSFLPKEIHMAEKDPAKSPDFTEVPAIEEKPFEPAPTSDTSHPGGPAIIDRLPFDGVDDER
jgi:hypothetical protein